jgi:hypothetical protein
VVGPSARAVGADQRAVEVDVGVPSGAGGEQGTVQARGAGGEHIDCFVEVAVDGGGADGVVDRELRHPGRRR